MDAPVTRGTLVLRYHSLGDVILTTGVIRALAELGAGPVEVATEARYRAIFDGNPHLTHLWERPEIERAAQAPSRPSFARVVDLQGTAGSRALGRRLGPTRSLRSRSLERRWIVWWGDRPPRPRIPHAASRYAEAAGLPWEGTDPAPPQVFVTGMDREALAREAPEWQSRSAGIRVALLTGASRRSKAYPLDLFREVGHRMQKAGVEIVWVEDPGGGRADGVGFRLRVGLSGLKAALSGVDLAISGDSGPMHLATALGVPTLALFGSSVLAFGFSPLGPSRVLGVEGLRCRPCGVHGRDRCWRGHWRCLRDLTPERVVGEAMDMIRTKERRS
ncbi:MAG: glycosyltransferase family 9 protein [Candidatus Eisenbacteria bacterium]|uniref:Glycosyltransferase family 9 protein n=1 Tax=Eiseniibacteriota bacterium TaxID=2212470 RepID=A0A956M420_UNCEI|nr:glycosyltransferase family 9 protein [Candidatus Eisenbacteria bacterium]